MDNQRKYIVLLALHWAALVLSMPSPSEDYDSGMTVNVTMTDEDTDMMACTEQYFPATFKQCDMGGSSEFLKAVVGCGHHLGLKLPCLLEWMEGEDQGSSVQYYNCTGHLFDSEDFWIAAEEKCFDGCVANRLSLEEKATPNLDNCASFLESLPMFKDQGLTSQEWSEFKTCLDTVLPDEGEISNDDPICKIGSRILLCISNAARKRAGGDSCGIRVCEKLASQS